MKSANWKKISLAVPSDYPTFLKDIKTRIQAAQTRATFAVNAELLQLYWDVGRTLTQRQAHAGWGARVLERLALDLKNELPEVKGFSERNLKLMTQFYRAYTDLFVLKQYPIRQPVVAQLPWAHNVILMQKLKNKTDRHWYAQKALENGWSRNVLALMIDNGAQRRHGRAVTNFKDKLPFPQSDLAQQALKGVEKAIGVSEYQMTRALPKEFQSELPAVSEIEKEMASQVKRSPNKS